MSSDPNDEQQSQHQQPSLAGISPMGLQPLEYSVSQVAEDVPKGSTSRMVPIRDRSAMTNESRMRQKRAYIERCKQAHMRKMGILYTQHRFVLTSGAPLCIQDQGIPVAKEAYSKYHNSG
jgi:hypothetical protein